MIKKQTNTIEFLRAAAKRPLIISSSFLFLCGISFALYNDFILEKPIILEFSAYNNQ